MFLSGQTIDLLAGSPLQLVWPQPPSNSTSLLDFNMLLPIEAGCQIWLPDATLAPSVQAVILWNVSSSETLDVYTYDGSAGGGTLILTMPTSSIYQFNMFDSSTQQGLWNTLPYVNSEPAIGNFTVNSPLATISVNGGTSYTVNASGQIVSLDLGPAAAGLADLTGDLGFLVVTGTGGPDNFIEYTVRTLTSDGNIVVTNPLGTDDDPLIGLNSNISVSQIAMSGTTYTSGTINSGSDPFTINGVIFNGSNIVGSPIAWVRFADTGGIITIQSAYNVDPSVGVTGSAGKYAITMLTAAPNTNYGITGTCGTTSVTPPPPLFVQSVYTANTTTVAEIYITDAGGSFPSDVANGIMVVIFSL